MAIHTQDPGCDEGSDTGEMFRAEAQSELNSLGIGAVRYVDHKVVFLGF